MVDTSDERSIGSNAIRVTPLIASPAVHERIGSVWLKLENLQKTGSFKVRGAVRKLARMSRDERARGVIAASAGNHGAGIALAAHAMGVTATIVVPTHAPDVKKQRMRAHGATIVVHGTSYDEAEAYAKDQALATGAVFVSPYDDDDIIDGNGRSLADELLLQAKERSIDLSMVVCPVGGGGLIAGLASRLAPLGVRVVGVQPEANCAMYESLQQGRAITQYDGKPTLAEGLEGAVADRTYSLVRQHVDDIVLVNESAIERAVAFCYRRVGTIVECSSAVAIAGFLERKVRPAANGVTMCVLTGGNIDSILLDRILRQSMDG